jgi:hypothetical protein
VKEVGHGLWYAASQHVVIGTRLLEATGVRLPVSECDHSLSLFLESESASAYVPTPKYNVTVMVPCKFLLNPVRNLVAGFQKIGKLMNFVGVKTVGHDVWYTASQHTLE